MDANDTVETLVQGLDYSELYCSKVQGIGHFKLHEVLKEAGKFMFASVKMVAEATVMLLGHVEGNLVPPRGHSLRWSRTGIFVKRHVHICMYRFVGHGTSAMEKSDFDQDLSRRRPSSK